MEPLKAISNKLKFAGNPRQITGKQFELLKSHIQELGDLSGVIYCHNNKAYVGGNQRSEVFNEASIEIIERYAKPTKNKTVAHGFILFNGEKFAYREVMFTREEFDKACIVANNDGGSFDWDIIANEWSEDLLKDWGMNIPDTSFSGATGEEKEAKEDEYQIAVIIPCNDEVQQAQIQQALIGYGYNALRGKAKEAKR
jgi:hypothetical protein